MRGLLLALELRRWRRAGRRPVLWWRDDDAREDTPALRRLLALAQASRVPLTLAAIPDGDRSSLAPLVAPGVTVVQHGVDHRNRRSEGGSGEFAPESELADIAVAVVEGWSRLAPLPGALKVFVPPWNAVHPTLPQALVKAGYVGWSAWSQARSPGPPPRVDAHLDLLRWGGGARFRGAGSFLARLTRLLGERRKAGDWAQPIGVLTHHLDHDEAAWAFLAELLARRDLDWRGLPDLLARARPCGSATGSRSSSRPDP